MSDIPKRRWRSRAVRVLDAQTHPVRDKIKDALVALSLANLCFGNAWHCLLDDATPGYYFKHAITASHLIALTANIALFALLFWCGALLVRRSSDWRVHFVGDIALCATLLVPFEFLRLHMVHRSYLLRLLPLLKHPWMIYIVIAVAFAAVLRWHRLTARLAKIIVAFCFPLAVVTLTKAGLMFLSVERAPLVEALPSAPPMFKPVPPRRVVWIIFDEMDQRVAFRQRPPGLQLPELDRLRRESFAAINAYPPSFCTRISMPALITGRLVDDTRTAGRDELILSLANGQEIGWSRLPNVFSRARELGFNTALVGWHHPYSRILGAALNYSDWYPNPSFSRTRAPTFWGSMSLQIRSMFPIFLTDFVDLYRFGLESSRPLVADPRYGLVLLHLFPPHAPAIYRRDTGQLTLCGTRQATGYLDNLALADRTLGELRRAMEASGVWSNTWVLISADHWWREARRLDGKLDHRIPFILKPVGASASQVYSSPFCTIITHDLLLAILCGDIHDAQELPSWMDQHKTAPPADYTDQVEDDISL